MKNSILISLVPLMFFSNMSEGTAADSGVSFELSRFLGKWYEIARFDHSFERGMDNVTAEYSMKEDGTIKVLNSGIRSGKLKTAEGKARLVDPADPKRLEVSFFLWFYTPYIIMDIADDYSYALIGSKSDKYLWILSRKPVMDAADLESVKKKASDLGYDIRKLIMVKQTENR